MQGYGGRRRWVALFCSLLAATGCDSPVELDSHAAGVVFVRSDGSEAARFVYPGSVSGALNVGVGATETFRVRVLTEDGDVIPVDGVAYSITQPRLVISLAATISMSGDDQVVVTGGAIPRNTTMFFDLMHGSHSEFRVEDVVVSVQ